MVIIVGSGPAGIAAAYTFIKRKIPVTIIDYGNELELEKSEVKNRLQTQSRSQWSEDDVTKLFSPLKKNTLRAIPQKLLFGSDFPYRDFELTLKNPNPPFLPSLAKGGLSNVWGAALLPYRDQDLMAWPFPIRELHSAYEEILEFMPCSSRSDQLAGDYPLFLKRNKSLKLSAQAKKLESQITHHRKHLADHGITAGQARLAVDVDRCTYCGFCLEGCAYDAIYSTSFTLKAWVDARLVTYRPNTRVQRVEEVNGEVQIHVIDKALQESVLTGHKCYLAAGVLGTAQIVKNSQPDIQSLQTLDSQYFVFPVLQLRASSEVDREELHNLCQHFVEVHNPKINVSNIHLQFYSYSLYFKKLMEDKLKMLPFSKALTRFLMKRILIVQGYLHSDQSGKIDIAFANDNNGFSLTLTPRSHPESKKIFQRLILLFIKHGWRLGIFPLFFQSQLGEPGQGSHCGGTLAMAQNPSGHQTDILGRAFGWKNIHIVDASIFPSVPSGPITMTVMANALRIARASF